MADPVSTWALGPDAMPILVGVGSGLATFVASVMGDEQNERLKNGTFGAVAGTSVGGLAGLLKNQPDLLIVGFFGSVIGAVAGWGLYLYLANKATKDAEWRTVLDFQIGGLKAVKDRIALDDQQKLLAALGVWRGDFSRMILTEKANAMSLKPECFAGCAQLAIETWITSVVDFFGFFFETLANKRNYRSRVTIIVFGKRGDVIRGVHWIRYSGTLKPHRHDQPFDAQSIGYQVLTQQKPSPFFTTSDSAQKEGQKREDDPTYRPFLTFRLNHSAVLALDWPHELAADGTDPYVLFAKDLFHALITPAVGELLNSWPRPLPTVVGLEPLD